MNEVVTHAAAALFGFSSSAALILVKRRRTRAVNSVRVLSAYFLKHLDRLEHSESELKEEIQRWLQYPNALGSEAQAAKLVANVQIKCNPSKKDLNVADMALNALDQRATERERQRDSS